MKGRKASPLFILPLAAAWAFGQDDATKAVTEISLFADEEMVVTASRHAQLSYEAPATVYVVSEEDIRRAGYRDLEEVLHDVPGFDFGRGFGTNFSQIYQRGFRSNNTNRTLLLVDGVEDNELWSNIAWISRQYPLSNIKRIEIIHGPASALYGANAFLGVVNVITKKGGEIGGARARLGGGSYSTGLAEVSAGRSWGEFELAVTGRAYRSDEDDLSGYPDWADSLYQDPSYHGAGAEDSRYENTTDDYAFDARVSWRGLSAGVLHWSTKEGYGAWYRAEYERTKGTWWHQNNTLAHLEHFASPGPGLRLTTKAQYHVSGIDGDSRSVYQGDLIFWRTDNYAWRLEEQIDYEITRQAKLSAGGQLDLKYVTEDYATDTLSPVGPVEPSKIRRIRQEGAFAQTEYMPFRDLVITLGTRLDHNSSFGFEANPRMGLVYMPLPVYTKFLFGTAYQAPTAWELFSKVQTRVPNPGLKPEKMRTFEFSLGHRGRSHNEEINFFLNDIRDIIQTVTVTDSVDLDGDGTIDLGKDQHRNLGRRIIYGLELRCRLKAGDRTEVSANYSYLNPWDLEGNRRVGDVSENKGNIMCNARLPFDLGLNLRVNLVGPRKTVPTNPVGRVPGYGVVHLCLTRQRLLVPNLEASLSVLNVLDHAYCDPGVRTANGDYYASLLPQPRRHLMAAVSYNYK